MGDFITALPPIVVSPTQTNPLAATTGVANTAGSDFAKMLGDVAARSIDTMAKAETTSISALQGKASLQQVVDAVTGAEQTLQTALAVRDKAVAAWLDISRMTI